MLHMREHCIRQRAPPRFVLYFQIFGRLPVFVGFRERCLRDREPFPQLGQVTLAYLRLLLTTV